MKFFTQISTADIFRKAQKVDTPLDGLKTDVDNPYMTAVEADDMETAQKMVDEAAKKAGYTIGPVWHSGTVVNVFDEASIGSATDEGQSGRGFYFAPDKSNAERYGNGNPRPFFLSYKKPFVLDFTTPEAARDTRERGLALARANDTRNITEIVRSAGYDATVVRSKSDYGEIVVFSPSKIKSADPVTYDKQKKPIPLEKRFDSSNSDIRY